MKGLSKGRYDETFAGEDEDFSTANKVQNTYLRTVLTVSAILSQTDNLGA